MKQITCSYWLVAAQSLATLLAAGCAAPARGPAVPPELQDRAVIPGMPASIRTWGDVWSPEFERELRSMVRLERERLAAAGHTGALPPAYFLAISGGGENGAFGAGLLCGWTEAGNRPQFKAVTGVSTGALIAPFAFLGTRYDPVLRTSYTQITDRDVFEKRPLLSGLTGDALANNKPLREMLDRLIDQEVVNEIAAEHAKGRVLLIGTSNLDAQRAVIWNATAIAASGHPRAGELIRRIMVASAAIPAAFPPVMFDVEVGGGCYQEMHVDGGVMNQVFVYPPSLKLPDAARAENAERPRTLYVIRNGRLNPDWQQVERRTLAIAGRAISSMIQTQGIGDLYRIFLTTQRDRIAYNLAYIPADFKAKAKEPFDQHYMNELFDRGFAMARNGYPWESVPPDYAGEDSSTR